MKHNILAVIAAAIALALTFAGSALAKDKHEYQVGTFLGTQMLADGTYTNDIHCGSGEDYTCTGSAGFNGFRAYYIRMDDGTVWSFVSDRENSDAIVRQFGMTPTHIGKEKPNLLDSLNPGDKVAFRMEKDHRIGAGNTYHVFIPRADDPKKEEKFEGYPPPTVSVASKPTDNIKTMCDAHSFSPDDEKKYCPQP